MIARYVGIAGVACTFARWKLMANRFELPDLGIGLGLRTKHYSTILDQKPAVDWFEIISENYLRTEGRPLDFLDQIADSYPVVMHGVSL